MEPEGISSDESAEQPLQAGDLVTSTGSLYDSYGRLALEAGHVAEVSRLVQDNLAELKSDLIESFFADTEKIAPLAGPLPEAMAQKAHALAERRNAHAVLIGCTFLGGYNAGLLQGSGLDVLLDDRGFHFFSSDSPIEPKVSVPFHVLHGIEISGPGKETTNAGIIGGGFGIEGIVLGVALASLVNAVTTRTTINTFFRIGWTDAEAFFHYDKLAPEVVRILFSRAFVAVRQAPREHSLEQG